MANDRLYGGKCLNYASRFDAKTLREEFLDGVALQTVKWDQIYTVGKMNIKIQLSNAFYDHAVYVAEIMDNSILGLDFLRKYNFVTDLKNNSLHSPLEDVTLFQPGTDRNKVCHQVISRQEITIPARREIIFAGVTDGDKNFPLGLIELPPIEKFPNGVLVVSMLVHLSKEVLPVRVINVTDRPISIKKGEVLVTYAAAYLC